MKIYMNIKQDIASKNILILGCGKSGNAIAKFLKNLGAKVFLYDDNNASLTKAADLLNLPIYTYDVNDFSFDVVVPSPGIKVMHEPHKIIELALAKSINIISDLDIFRAFDVASLHIGVTGSNGKSTTTTLIHHILQNNELDVDIGGNIGIPFTDMRMNAARKVLEVSSYQLENAVNVNFDIAVVTNISPEHLDHHGSMENYIKAKQRICSAKYVVLNYDDLILREKFANLCENVIYFSATTVLDSGFSLIEDLLYINGQLYDTLKLKMPGKHNRENVAAAIAATTLVDGALIEKIVQACKDFNGLSHRIETIRKIGNILFINDSKATNADSTEKALMCFEGNVILIAGGVAKTEGIDKLRHLYSKIDKIMLIGKDAIRFEKELQDSGFTSFQHCGNIATAINESYRYAAQRMKNLRGKDVIILLSPLCASFDQYNNFEERGDDFRKIVMSL
jgi:UDP-N-acetylmuramoylalanine--D-glutamate ligase